MKVLLTNDDGIAAAGLWAAARAMASLGRVIVVAPATNCSGYGTAWPPARTLSYFPYRHYEGHPPNVTAYGFVGTPAACVHVGLTGIFGGGPFDLVISGINHGANVGRDILYSGTVGAAFTAYLMGIPAIAISLDIGQPEGIHWDTAIWALDEVLRLRQANPEPTPLVLNVNVPNVPKSQVWGTMMTSITSASFLPKYRFSPDLREDRILVTVHTADSEPEPEPWTDAWAIKLGYVSITPLKPSPDLFCMVPWPAPPANVAFPLHAIPA